jgi:hypothetical protein
MTLAIELPAEVEAVYAAEASAKGVPLEQHIVEQLIARAPRTNERNGAPKPQARHLNLPQLRGTVIGSLRREDIYDGRG